MKRRSQPKVKRIKKPSYGDKVRENKMMYGPNPNRYSPDKKRGV